MHDLTIVASHTIYSAIVGSRAYGLAGESSDTDRRGVFQAPTRSFWPLQKPPTHVEGPLPEQFSWELERACTLALAANPTVLECLWSPLVERVTPVGRDLLAIRGAFLSRRTARTYGDYARDQLAKLTSTRAKTGQVRWKQAMHMARLLRAGAHVLTEGEILVDVTPWRDELLSIRRGDLSWDRFAALASTLEADLESAAASTPLPDDPDRTTAESFLVAARSHSATGTAPPPATQPAHATTAPATAAVSSPAKLSPAAVEAGVPGWAGEVVDELAYPVVFATVSGAHLYGFASVDSDLDLRACHLLPLAEVVGLHTGPETVQVGGEREGMELDVVAQELAKFVRLLLKPNGYVLEQLLSPLVVRTSELHDELAALSRHCVTSRHAHHYLGFAAGQWRLFQQTGELKPALYTLRVLHTGIHLMHTGELQADLRPLATLPYVADMIEAKKAGEHRLLPADLVSRDRLTDDVESLTAALESARDASPLPATPSAGEALEALLIRTRLGHA